MADTTTKTKILDIQTGKAQRNVKTLREQIKDLKNEMAGLEKNTVEYDKAAQKLANLNQKQIEINEAMKFSNKDLGATLSNLTKVTAGVVGAISSVNSVMVMMGADSEEAMEAMKRIQALMAIIQGLGAIDTAVKALKGLTVAFQGFNDVRQKTILTSVGASGAELAEAGALGENTVKMSKNNEVAKDFNKYNDEGAEATKRSKDAITDETKQIILNTQAKEQNVEKTQELIEKLEKLSSDRELETSNAQNIGFTKAIEEYERRIKEYQSNLERYGNVMPDNVKKETQEKLKYYQTALQKILMTSTTTTDDIIVAVEGSLNSIVNNYHSSFEDIEEDVLTFNQLLKGLPFDVAQEKAQQANDFFQRCIASFQMAAMKGEEGAEEALKDFMNIQYMLGKETAATLETIKEREAEIANTERLLDEETASLNTNTAAKEANAEATDDVTDAEKKLGTETKKNDPILKKAWSGITNGIKNAAKAIKAFIATNPILTGIMAAVAAIGAGIALWAKSYNDAHKEAYELKKMNIELDMEFKKQKTDMETLVRMFNQENLTAKEKETLAKEINKLAGDELVARNKITGEWEIQIEKMQEYQRNLRTQIELEYHKKAILEAMDKEEEARQDANYERNHFIGNLWNSEGDYLEDAAEAVAEQEKHWKAIEKLTSNVVENIDKENKKLDKTTKGGGIKKTFADLSKELKALWKDFYAQLTKEKEIERTFDGMYSEALIAYDKIVEAIDGSMLGKRVSKEFIAALKTGLKGINSEDITTDLVFGEEYLNDLKKRMNEAKNELRKLFDEGKKVTDKQVQNAKKRIDQLKEEIEENEKLLNAAKAYKKIQEDIAQTRKETSDANALYNKQQEINLNYKPLIRREQGRDFQYEETNRQIEQQRLLYQTTMKRLTEEKAKLDELNAKKKRNIEDDLKIAELEKKIAEDQKAANEAQIQMDELRYQKRLTKLDEEYAAIERNSEIEQQWYEIEQSIKGGGVADYNIDVDLLEMQLEAIVEKANMVDEYYKKLQEQHDENSQEWYVLEQERLAAQEALQRQYIDKEIEMEQEKSKRKLSIQKAYIAAYQNISSQVSNILGTLMNEYDENSKEYLNLKYAQGVTDTLSGTLAAYMSGIESGIPAPGNTILAGVMAAMTFATGIAQLRNIKNNSLSNAATANTVEIGNEYDTLSYAQNAEILSNIQDQRVWVSIHDIQDTGHRVEVMEQQATF